MRILKITGVLGAVAAVLFVAPNAFAEESTAVLPEVAPAEIAPTKVLSPSVRVKEERPALDRLKATGASKAELEKAKAEKKIQERMKAASTTAERVKAVREEAQTRIKAEREKAKERIALIKDKQRQEKAQKLLSQFEHLNKVWTDKFSAELERLAKALEKIRSRAATAAAHGRDVTAVNAAIKAAQDALATAEADVTAQAAKTYAPDTSAMSTTVATDNADGQTKLVQGLKEAYQKLHKALFADLFALRDGPMKLARRAVHDALAELKKIPAVDEGTASSSPNQ